MCTVSFIPVKNSIYICSSRQENRFRTNARTPHIYKMATGKILMPRDEQAGGTWIALHENGNAVVFLNGAHNKHQSNPPYRRSRGFVLLEILDSIHPNRHFAEMDLNRIEPFTAIIWENYRLFECLWDGEKKYSIPLHNRIGHLWSSSTLYDEQAIKSRKEKFSNWLSSGPKISLESISDFHQNMGGADIPNNPAADGRNLILTVSFTGIELKSNYGRMKHLDLRYLHSGEESLSFTRALIAKE